MAVAGFGEAAAGAGRSAAFGCSEADGANAGAGEAVCRSGLTGAAGCAFEAGAWGETLALASGLRGGATSSSSSSSRVSSRFRLPLFGPYWNTPGTDTETQDSESQSRGVSI